ncbi:MAG: hypothetical protein IJI35_03035 [Kiritimatiellae bacterium]|nr:hypothetical protein [Kiritimatiellia bacterium]
MKAVMSIISAFVVGAVFAEQPDKWVRYVESTGNQAIDTGIEARPGTKTEAHVEWLELADHSFAGARTSGSGNDRYYFCYSGGNGVILTGHGPYQNVTASGYTCFYEFKRRYSVVSEFSAETSDHTMTNTVFVDGRKLYTAGTTAFSTGSSIALFSCRTGSSALSAGSGYNCKARCYGFKIWQDGTLVRDYIPCMKGGRAGLYDDVSKTIFYSVTGTDLVCDEDSCVPDEFIDYVEAHGDAYIDTGIIGRSGTDAEFKMRWMEEMTQKNKDASILGSLGEGDTRFFMWFFGNRSIAFGHGTFRYIDKTDPSRYMRYGISSGSEAYDGGKVIVYQSRDYVVSNSFAVGRLQIKYDAVEGGEMTTLLDCTSDTSNVNSGYPLYIFAANVEGEAQFKANARLYYMKIMQDGELVRDLRPCLKNGEPGLYDAVSGRIFFAAQGRLLAPPRITKIRKKQNVTFVEYIASDGYTTLDTGVRAKSGTRAAGEFSWVQLRNGGEEKHNYVEDAVNRDERAYLAAADTNARGGTFFYMVHEGNQKLWVGHAGSGGYPTMDAMSAGTKYAFDVTLADGTQTFSLDGANIYSGTAAGSVDTGVNLMLFSGIGRFHSAARCYGLKLWQGDPDGSSMQLVRDFKPCIVDGKAMLYDEISKSVFKPSPDIPASGNTGNIVLTGEEKPAAYVEYVESDGTIFVDTGITGKSGTAADMEMAFLAKADTGFLESRTSTVRYYLLHNGAGYAMVGWSDWYYVPASEGGMTKTASFAMTLGQKYHVESSLATGSQTVRIDGTLLLNDTKTDNIDTGCNLHIFACDQNGAPTYASKSRLYWLKLYQDGNLVRDFKPVRLNNGLVVLWDFKEGKAYPAQSTASPYDYTFFSKVGPEGDAIVPGLMIFIR